MAVKYVIEAARRLIVNQPKNDVESSIFQAIYDIIDILKKRLRGPHGQGSAAPSN